MDTTIFLLHYKHPFFCLFHYLFAFFYSRHILRYLIFFLFRCCSSKSTLQSLSSHEVVMTSNFSLLICTTFSSIAISMYQMHSASHKPTPSLKLQTFVYAKVVSLFSLTKFFIKQSMYKIISNGRGTLLCLTLIIKPVFYTTRRTSHTLTVHAKAFYCCRESFQWLCLFQSSRPSTANFLALLKAFSRLREHIYLSRFYSYTFSGVIHKNNTNSIVLLPDLNNFFFHFHIFPQQSYFFFFKGLLVYSANVRTHIFPWFLHFRCSPLFKIGQNISFPNFLGILLVV